jgi:hypothetical protein
VLIVDGEWDVRIVKLQVTGLVCAGFRMLKLVAGV